MVWSGLLWTRLQRPIILSLFADNSDTDYAGRFYILCGFFSAPALCNFKNTGSSYKWKRKKSTMLAEKVISSSVQPTVFCRDLVMNRVISNTSTIKNLSDHVILIFMGHIVLFSVCRALVRSSRVFRTV